MVRSSHHSDALEVELARRDIPFVKFGGLKFLEASHVKDVLCLLRWAENPRDSVAAFRTLQLLPGIGPRLARRALDRLEAAGFDLGVLRAVRPPPSAAADWPAMCELLLSLRDSATDWHGQVGMVRRWYEPQLERLYVAPHVRAADLEQLEQISSAYATRERFLSELALDPPDATGNEAGPPLLDEDYLILSTIHSAKGREWDVVYVLNASDGCIPSDMATGSGEQIDEERRLLYVAMTRARDHLYLIHPLRFFRHHQHRYGDGYVYAPRSRFLPDEILDRFQRDTSGREHAALGLGSRSQVRRCQTPRHVELALTPLVPAVQVVDLGLVARAALDRHAVAQAHSGPAHAFSDPARSFGRDYDGILLGARVHDARRLVAESIRESNEHVLRLHHVRIPRKSGSRASPSGRREARTERPPVAYRKAFDGGPDHDRSAGAGREGLAG